VSTPPLQGARIPDDNTVKKAEEAAEARVKLTTVTFFLMIPVITTFVSKGLSSFGAVSASKATGMQTIARCLARATWTPFVNAATVYVSKRSKLPANQQHSQQGLVNLLLLAALMLAAMVLVAALGLMH
jgi:hypothetical protein